MYKGIRVKVQVIIPVKKSYLQNAKQLFVVWHFPERCKTSNIPGPFSLNARNFSNLVSTKTHGGFQKCPLETSLNDTGVKE